MSQAGKVLLIGLDSADAELIRRWSDEGHLPTFAKLRAEGVWAELDTTAKVMHVSAWPSLYTGTRPGKHGMYHAYQIKAGDQDVHRTRADEIGQPPFWKHLDAAGVKTIVFDAFMNAPLEGFGGIQILEYGTWTWFEEPGATPNEMWRSLTSRFGAYPAPEHTKIHGRPEAQPFLDDLLAGARVKGEALRWLLKGEAWDLCFVTFGEPHPAGHYLWHVADPDYPLYPGAAGAIDTAVRDVYAAVDRAIGQTLEELGDDVTVMITSGDGMGPNFAGCQHVPEALHRLDLYHGADVGRPKPEPGAEARPKKSLASRLRGMVPLELRRAVNRCLPASVQHRLSMKWQNADIDWSRTRAFCIPNANEGYVRINRAGREPKGLVDDSELAQHLAEIQGALSELTVPGTGAKAVEAIHDVERLFPGGRRGDLPDLSVTWSNEARVLAELESDRIGHIQGKPGHETAPYYTGNHRPTAFVLARGPGLPAGGTIEGGDVVDLAPTLLAHFGVTVPEVMDGTPWSVFAG